MISTRLSDRLIVLLTAVSLLTATCFCLSSCSGKDDDFPKLTYPDENGETSSDVTPSSSASDTGSETVEAPEVLRVNIPYSQETAEALFEMYKDEYGIDEDLKIELASEDADIFTVYSGSEAVGSEDAMPLDGYLANYITNDQDRLFLKAVYRCTDPDTGSVYGIPHSFSVTLMMIRKDLLPEDLVLENPDAMTADLEESLEEADAFKYSSSSLYPEWEEAYPGQIIYMLPLKGTSYYKDFSVTVLCVSRTSDLKDIAFGFASYISFDSDAVTYICSNEPRVGNFPVITDTSAWNALSDNSGSLSSATRYINRYMHTIMNNPVSGGTQS